MDDTLTPTGKDEEMEPKYIVIVGIGERRPNRYYAGRSMLVKNGFRLSDLRGAVRITESHINELRAKYPRHTFTIHNED